jgi:CRP-like cAMP-binding protein
MISMLPTYFTGEGSLFYMQALRSTEVIIIAKSDLDNYMSEHPEHHQDYSELLQGIISQQMEREIDLLTTSPQERLFRVMNRSPKVFQEIPLKYIASYLRMTPETLSRIMKSNS